MRTGLGKLPDVDFAEILDQHDEEGAVATLALVRSYQVPVGVAEVEGNRLVRWAEKPSLEMAVGVGVMALSVEALGELPRLSGNNGELDLARDLILYLVQSGDRVGAFFTEGFWYDVGSIEEYGKLDGEAVENRFGFLYGNGAYALVRTRDRLGLRGDS